MQLCQPVPAIFTMPYEPMYSYGSREDELMITVAKIPGLQHLANIYLTKSGATTERFDELICHATILDRELSCWASNASATWSYSAASNANTFARFEFYPRQVHRYQDYYTARVWNLYRVSRLIVQSLLLRALTKLPDASSQMELNRADIERRGKELVDHICASVPFLLGRDLSKMTLPAAKGAGEQENIRQTQSSRTGTFSLLWPLYVARSAPLIPAAQQEWMRLQLQLITEQWEPQARCLCQTESQILLGGTETFRFDCV